MLRGDFVSTFAGVERSPPGDLGSTVELKFCRRR